MEIPTATKTESEMTATQTGCICGGVQQVCLFETRCLGCGGFDRTAEQQTMKRLYYEKKDLEKKKRKTKAVKERLEEVNALLSAWVGLA